MVPLENSTKHTKKNLYWSFSNSSKYWWGENIPKVILWCQNHPRTTTKQRAHQNRGGGGITGKYFWGTWIKHSQQNFSKMNPTTHKKAHIPWSSWIHPRVPRIVQYMQINQCDTTYQPKKKDKKTTWLYQQMQKKAFDKIQHPFMIKKKTSYQSGERGNISQHNKSCVWQTYSQHNTRWWKAFPLKSGTRQWCALLLFLFNIVLESININQIRKRNKRYPNWKKWGKIVIICRWQDTIHRENPKDAT